MEKTHKDEMASSVYEVKKYYYTETSARPVGDGV